MSIPEEAWSVQKLANTLKSRVEDGFPSVWVRGELVGVKRYPSGHIYFGLRDELAKVDCMIWRSSAERLTMDLEDGAEVFARGKPNLWEERTSLRFQISQLLPAAEMGAAAQLLEKTRKRLLADGLLDPARKRPLPEFPRRIVIITSSAGAAVRDVIIVAKRRWPAIELLVINSAVQGERASAELVAALKLTEQLENIDCCIIGRGGGAKEDLAAFNDEAVCRAVAGCKVPVISAVGHEVDVTLTDLVADKRAATPSQAAEFALPDHREVTERVNAIANTLGNRTRNILEFRSERLKRTGERMGNALLQRLRVQEQRLHRAHSRLPSALENRLREPRRRLQECAGRLEPALQIRLERVRSAIGRNAAQLDALSPLAVLGRGYSLARSSEGDVLKKVEDFGPGKQFSLTVTDGDVAARVEDA